LLVSGKFGKGSMSSLPIGKPMVIYAPACDAWHAVAML